MSKICTHNLYVPHNIHIPTEAEAGLLAFPIELIPITLILNLVLLGNTVKR